MIKEKELLEDINSYIDQYMSELTKQQAKSILDNLSFIYYKTKNLIIELEGVENSCLSYADNWNIKHYK